MKLTITLLVLVALGHATIAQSTARSRVAKSAVAKSTAAKRTQAKTLETKPKDNNTTSKRELYEGNFGERNKVELPIHEVTELLPKVVFERELKDLLLGHSPNSQNQIFGVRLPQQITKISDVLTGHGPSFEAAIARQLYSPVSVYHNKHPSPTSFKVPISEVSQSDLPNPQEAPPKVKPPNTHKPEETRNQVNVYVESFPKHQDPELSRQQVNLPPEILRPQQMLTNPTASLFPIYDQLGPFRYQGEVVPSEFLHERGLYNIFPVHTRFDYDDQERSRDNNYPNHGSQQPFNTEPTEIPKLQPVPNQDYRAHPNGAISFASFSNQLPFRKQYYNSATQQQPDSVHQSQPIQLGAQRQPEVMLQAEEQKIAPVKPMVYRLIQEVEKYEPVYQQQPQRMPFQQQMQSQHRTLNALQQHLLFQVPQQFSNSQLIGLQQLPSFKPLPESLLTPELLQEKTQLPILSNRSPRPFTLKDQFAQPPVHINIPIEPESTQHPLPSLQPNYSTTVKLLKPHSHTTPAFLPTPLLIPTSTAKGQPVSDQLISSTTLQPTLKNHKEPNKTLITKEFQPQSLPQPQPQPQPQSQPQSQPHAVQLAPQVVHQSQPTGQFPPIEQTTYLPFLTHTPPPQHVQHTSPQPKYVPTKPPQSTPTSPRHDVVIQRQEIQELILEPHSTPAVPAYFQKLMGPQQERDPYLIRSQDQQQLLEQLLPLQHQEEFQELNSEQYLLDTRQLRDPHPQQVLEQAQHQQQQVKSDDKIRTFTLKSSHEPEEQNKADKRQQRQEHKPLQQEQSLMESATEKPKEQILNILQPTSKREHAFSDSIGTPIQPVQPQIHEHPQYMTAYTEYNPAVSIPLYSDVQYFGKFAKSLLGHNHY